MGRVGVRGQANRQIPWTSIEAKAKDLGALYSHGGGSEAERHIGESHQAEREGTGSMRPCAWKKQGGTGY